jgi:DNA polymerase
MSENREELIRKTLNYLQSQKEIFGEVEIPAASAEKPDQNVPAEVSVIKESVKKDEASSEKPSLEEQLKGIQSLGELRAFCSVSAELKTDLDGTNLVFGVGNPDADLMVIGEAPGEQEDLEGEPFVGKAGQLLTKILKAIKFEREDVYIANILKHRPPNNRDPKPEERQRSLPYLMRQIELIQPKLILCVGKVSGTTLLGKDDSLKNMRQKFHPFMNGIELMVTYHPAALLRNPNWKRPCWEDVQLLKKRYEELKSST